jgi:hypothetical protein
MWLTELMKSIDPNLTHDGCRGPAMGEHQGNDLNREQCVLLAVRSAFPLPGTGTFTDLLSAIDEAERSR